MESRLRLESFPPKERFEAGTVRSVGQRLTQRATDLLGWKTYCAFNLCYEKCCIFHSP